MSHHSGQAVDIQTIPQLKVRDGANPEAPECEVVIADSESGKVLLRKTYQQ